MKKGTIVLFLLLGAASCSEEPSPPPRWHFTCGDPVCRGYSPDAGLAVCTSERAGDLCAPEGAGCDPLDDCNRRLMCSSRDPVDQGCPVSLASAKRDIHYVDAEGRRALRDSLLRVPLATWNYRSDDPARRPRVGFLIDDVGPGPAVTPDGGHVDLYGYTSLAVAAVQEQQAEIDALRQEVAALRRELEQARTPR